LRGPDVSLPGKISPVQIFAAFIIFFFSLPEFWEGGRRDLEAGNRKPYYEVEVKADINTDVVNIFGGDKDRLCET
jgi:hypothetical protein